VETEQGFAMEGIVNGQRRFKLYWYILYGRLVSKV